MRRALSTCLEARAYSLCDASALTSAPLRLHPAIKRSGNSLRRGFPTCRLISQGHRFQADIDQIATSYNGQDVEKNQDQVQHRPLPLTCSGCGAFSQTSDPEQIGYYDTSARRVKRWTHPMKVVRENKDATQEDEIVNATLAALSHDQMRQLKLDSNSFRENSDNGVSPVEKDGPPPVCDRCHSIVHHNLKGNSVQTPIFHPTIESLRETIEESPHKYNHIYHIIDAIDFPMSLIPRLNVLLGADPLRSRNRRTRGAKYQGDRQTLMSFIITRGDLLGPTKEIVDKMMPYLREVLRSALGRIGPHIRLGNLRCVSAKRGWWTQQIKDDVWGRGGGNWMVGKVNTGKSQLFESIYPKGRAVDTASLNQAGLSIHTQSARGPDAKEDQVEDFGELLPPPQPLQMYPQMPLVSPISGTTMSPIRVPFGNGGGELIDLPGLSRGGLEDYVKPEYKLSLITEKRIIPQQISIGNEESVVLGGGLIRITPRTPDLTFLLYNFTPLKEHVCSTWKAEGYQNQTRDFAGLNNITLPEFGEKMKIAGSIKLRYDVTKLRAGPLTRKQDVGLSIDRLPFRVLSADILIEGIGYVEVVAQVRTKSLKQDPALRKPEDIPAAYEPSALDESLGPNVGMSSDPFDSMTSLRRDSSFVPEPESKQQELWPVVDVYTPEGQGIAYRQPIQGWVHNKPLVREEHKKSRPRKSIKHRHLKKQQRAM